MQLLRNVNDSIQQIDLYPKGRQMLHDEEYLAVLKVRMQLVLLALVSLMVKTWRARARTHTLSHAHTHTHIHTHIHTHTHKKHSYLWECVKAKWEVGR